MTKTSKKILITFFSIMMVFCTFLGITLTFPITTVNAEESTDYLSWERTELKTGDLIANRYLMLDMSFYNDEGKQIPYGDSVDDDSSLFNYLMFGLDSLNDKDLFLTTANTEDGLHFFWPIYKDTNYYVWYIEIFEEPPYEFNERTPLKDSSVVILNGKEQNIDGFYFLTEPEEPEDEIPDVPTDLPTFDSANYNVTYLSSSSSSSSFCFTDSYFVVPENILSGNILMFELEDKNYNPYFRFSYAHYLTYYSGDGSRQALILPIAITNRYGVKSYVYDFTKDQTITDSNGETFVLEKSIFKQLWGRATEGADYDNDVTVNDCYLLTLKGSASSPEGSAGSPDDEDLPTINSANYDVTYLPKAISFAGSYFVVPENIVTGNIIIFEFDDVVPCSLTFDSADSVLFKYRSASWEAILNPVSVINSNGVKHYVYDFTKDQTVKGTDGQDYTIYIKDLASDPVIASGSGADYDNDVTVNDCFILTPKNNAGVPGDKPGNENPVWDIVVNKETTDFGKFLEKINNFFAENTGIVLGSTGSLVVLAIALWLLFRRR